MTKVKAEKEQSIIDLVIQEYGDISGLVAFAKDNNLAVDADLVPGEEYLIDPAKILRPEVVNFYRQQDLRVIRGNYVDVTL